MRKGGSEGGMEGDRVLVCLSWTERVWVGQVEERVSE